MQLSTESSKLRKLILSIACEISYLPFLDNIPKYPIIFHCMKLNDHASEWKKYHPVCYYLDRAVFIRNYGQFYSQGRSYIVIAIFGKQHQNPKKANRLVLLQNTENVIQSRDIAEWNHVQSSKMSIGREYLRSGTLHTEFKWYTQICGEVVSMHLVSLANAR